MLFTTSLLALALSQIVLGDNKSHTLPKFESSDVYFEQSDSNISPSDVNYTKNFGLKDQYSWKDVLDQTDEYHKLFFIIRHAFGVHQCNTPSTDWTCYWQTLDGYDGQVWADALLTQQGIDQSKKLSQQIKNTKDFPYPDHYYSSPLRRTLETWDYVWSDLTSKGPIIKEFARETYGIQTESKRHDKNYISLNWPHATFEQGFTTNDELWKSDKRETGQHRKYRAASVLNDIFDAHKDDKVISLVSHSGLIGSILDVVGHRNYPVDNAVLIPILIQRKKNKTKTYKLDDPDKTFADICPDKPSTITEGPELTCSAGPFDEKDPSGN
ncbi:PMU1 [Candida pseudojiufengensis]|uniref:PMU1 n=1 Tax=Candida pseudojiufengensis TaxID=497109 RepID=UPI0022247B98|nr:PMU1 [Candida pseudojiufengensis]KAI5961875.1 PMU1 [Candida pseudojiufengensis]